MVEVLCRDIIMVLSFSEEGNSGGKSGEGSKRKRNNRSGTGINWLFSCPPFPTHSNAFP